MLDLQNQEPKTLNSFQQEGFNNFLLQKSAQKEKLNHLRFDFEAIRREIGFEAKFILQRLVFLLSVQGKTVVGQSGVWIYNSCRAWHSQLKISGFSLYKIERVLLPMLVEEGWIFRKKLGITNPKNNAKLDPVQRKKNQTFWYTVNFEKLNLFSKEVLKTNQFNTYREKIDEWNYKCNNIDIHPALKDEDS